MRTKKKNSFQEPHDKSSFLEVSKIMKLGCWLRSEMLLKMATRCGELGNKSLLRNKTQL